jgi:hypothetical protein
MLPMAFTGAWFAIFNVLLTLSGSLGAFALFQVVRYLVGGKSERFVRSWIPTIFSAAALLGLWAMATGEFRVFEIIPAVVFGFMPSLATIHLLWLVRRRLQRGSDFQVPVERTIEHGGN